MARNLIAAAALLCWLGPLAAPAALAYPRLEIQADSPLNGIFDPSVEYAPGAAVGWLAYSAIFGPLQPWGPHVETRLAQSLDGGATWSFVAVVSPSLRQEVVLPDGSTQDAVLNSEVPCLVYDADDPGREWKLFTHRIFRLWVDPFQTEQSLPAQSWIAYRTAPQPTGPWSEEIALFGSGPLPTAPYRAAVQVAVNDLDASLSDILVYSEPGAFYRAGVLYVSLVGLLAQGPDRVVLLASDDHGTSWRYVSTPATSSDAQALGYGHFDGSALVEDAGRVFLLVTPSSDTYLHEGTLALEFEDLASGVLRRRSDGRLVMRARISIQPGFGSDFGGGQSDYHEGNGAGGLLMPQLRPTQYPEIFQVFSTGERIVSPAALPPLSIAGRAAVAGLLLGVAVRRQRRHSRRRDAALSDAKGG